jgi:hypothetical protein
MLIAEELLLLSMDSATGKSLIGKDRLGPALGGALVAELALMERIGVTPHDAGWSKRGRITITNLTPTVTRSWTRPCASSPRARARRSRTC